MEEICGVAAAMGNPCIVLDREQGTRIASGGCLDLGEEVAAGADPGKRRCASIQNVTINLPRLGYRAWESDDGKFFSLLDDVLRLAIEAHVQKRSFIDRLLSLGDAGPLAMLAMKNDGSAYLEMAEATYLIGVTGLNELVRIRKGRQLHESEEALEWGLSVIGHIREEAKRQGQIHGMKLLLEQTPCGDDSLPFCPPRPETVLSAAGPLRPG